ncbi:RDD family protein [Candidatus Nitrosocosmicus franklandus]|nr:RDD family protein [Candidatus Nitrosocosmicus franklandus]
MTENRNGDNNPSKNSNQKYSREILLAKWEDRFVAWLIDFIIISIVANILFYIFTAHYSFPFWGIYINGENGIGIRQPYEYFAASSIFFVYWVILEFLTGQTIGKRVVNIKTTNLFGERANITNIAIEVFGKSFLLPIDIILGLIFSSKRRQRIFSKVSGTIVIKLKKTDEDENESIRYVKDH